MYTVLPPSIIAHPQSQLEVHPGQNVVFAAVAQGDDLQYQWQKDNVKIFNMPGVYSGTDTPTLTVISADEPEDEGVYIVVVSNTGGLVTTDPATLEIGES